MNDTLAKHGFKIGGQVIVKVWPTSTTPEVVDTSDRALLTLQAPNGATLRVGRLAVTKTDEAREVPTQ